METVAVVGYEQETNVELVEAWRILGLNAVLLSPADAVAELGPGDVALGRLDVRQTLDGVQPGLAALETLESVGARVINHADALLAAHDKILTNARLAAARIPVPVTRHVETAAELRRLPLPIVLKPRFGSWGRDVFRCRSRFELEDTIRIVAACDWFRSGGVVCQELLPSPGFDLRLIVAGYETVGGIERIAAAGEWRTNISLGGTIRPIRPDTQARRLGSLAARAIGCELLGVDLFPSAGGYVVLEVNGAVEFDRRYSLAGSNVYEEVAERLLLRPLRRQGRSTSGTTSTGGGNPSVVTSGPDTSSLPTSRRLSS